MIVIASRSRSPLSGSVVVRSNQVRGESEHRPAALFDHRANSSCIPASIYEAPAPVAILPLVFWYWFFVAPALLLAFLSLRGERKRANYVAERLAAETAQTLPPATVIVPVKGEDDGLRENLAALASLDYPDYELIVVAQDAADIPPGVLPDRARVVLAHAGDPSTGEKVRNLQAAVRAARRRSEVLAFADSDGRPSPGWLRALIAPLNEKGVGASTGFRWFTPDPPTFWTLLRSVWDAVAAGRLGPGDNPFVWGGAMAIRRNVFVE